jgi:hypothetical protein
LRLAILFLLCSLWSFLGGDQMDVEKQREIIRLWNRMRQVEGPVAEEIRIQILECFAQREPSSARLSNRREVLSRVRVPTGQVHRIGERGNNATL